MLGKSVSFLVSILILFSLVGTSCTTDTTPVPATETPTATTTTSTTEPANWWDTFGEPEYGGELVLREPEISISADPDAPMGLAYALWLESLFASDWTVDRDVWSFPSGFVPEEYISGLLAESWEWTDPQTVTVKIREGIHWQNKPPVNGRELTAEDVQYSYDRMLGTGSGFTEPNAFWGTPFSQIERVVATDKYTVEFRLKEQNEYAIYQILEGQSFAAAVIIPREWVEQGNTQDWQAAVGTGPWILTEYVDGSSLVYSRNPDYWGYDERHPENQLPYLDTLKYLIIPDQSTALTAMRTGQIDMMTCFRTGTLTLQQAQSLAETNPEIIQYSFMAQGTSLEIRCDKDPFTDIRVRKALNMAIDRGLIAQTYYGGTLDGKPTSIVAPYYTGYAFEYEDWPQELKDEYGYNPEEARELLAAAGYPDGFDTNCIASSGDAIELLEILKAFFMDIGVDMEIVTMDPQSLRNYAMDKKHDAMVLSARMAEPSNPLEAISRRVYTSDGCWNCNNDEVFASMVEELYSATTLDETKALSQEADRYNLEHHWSVYVCPSMIHIAWQPYVKGYSGETFANGWIGQIPTRLWIDQELKGSK